MNDIKKNSFPKELTKKFGYGFTVHTIYSYRQFYQTFPEIFHTLCGILSQR